MKMLKTVVIVIELVYPMIFFMISPFIDPRIIEGWTFLSLSLSLYLLRGWLGFLLKGFLEENR